MQVEHRSYSVGINPSPGDGELTVLFSGEAQPQGLHGIGPAIYDYYLIHTVLSGQGEFVIRDVRYSCREGDTFIIFPDELFSYQADDRKPWSYMWVAINGHGIPAIMRSLGVSPERPVISNSLSANVRGYYRQLYECLVNVSLPELTELEAGGFTRLLLQQFGHAMRKNEAYKPTISSETDRLMKQAIQYLTLQYTQQISIEHLAGMMGYHRTHLSKLFKQSTGISPMQFLLKVRMERAELLLTSPMTIDQVASSVGFSDALYFSKKFRKWSGHSPSEYRKALRNHL